MIAKVNGKLLSLLLKMILNLSNLTEEMEKRLSDQLRYLTISAIDEEWELTSRPSVTSLFPRKGTILFRSIRTIITSSRRPDES